MTTAACWAPRGARRCTSSRRHGPDPKLPCGAGPRASGLVYTSIRGVSGGGGMEEVMRLLRELNEPVTVPLELPDDDRLVEVEEELLINLPYVLGEFLLLVSDVVYGRLERVTAVDRKSHTYLPEIAALAWDAGVERDLLPICQDGN